MLLESFSAMILKFLRIPPGTSLRKANGAHTSSSGNYDIEHNDYLNTILDITVDDICIGEDPISITCSPSTPEAQKIILEQIAEEFNNIARWVARDLCAYGYSIYDVDIDKDTNRMLLFPYLDEVQFFLTRKKKILAWSYDDQGKEKKNLQNKLIFINYDRTSLSKIEDSSANTRDLPSDVLFAVAPIPMQLKNIENTLKGLVTAEDSIAKYRGLLRPARWINVDVGTAQGDQMDSVVDGISSAINCNSTGLGNGTSFAEFDDNLPVLPNRKGLGRADIAESLPTANVAELADLDYWVNKLVLLMRFPGSYLDFTKELGSSATSLIRSDLRYYKLCKSVRALMITTMQDMLNTSKFASAEPDVNMTEYPSSEDADVLQALGDYADTASSIDNYIIGEDGDKTAMRHRLKILRTLYGMSTNSPGVDEWFNSYTEYIDNLTPAMEGGDSPMGGGDSPLGGGGGGLDLDEPLGGPEDFGSGDLDDIGDESEDDFELVEPA